jgi:transitional endoplasmic reticulum ATPase
MNSNIHDKEEWKRVRRKIGWALIEHLGFVEQIPDYLLSYLNEKELIELVDILSKPLEKSDKSWFRDDLKALKENREKRQLLPGAYRDFIQGVMRRDEYQFGWSITTYLRRVYSSEKEKPLSLPQGIRSFCETFNLSEEEGRIVTFFYVMDNESSLERSIKVAGSSAMAEMFSSLLGIEVNSLSNLLGPKGKLSLSGVIVPDHRVESLSDYRLNGSVHMIVQTGNMELFREHLFLPDRKFRYGGDQFSVPKKHREQMLALLKGGSQILLTGRPGTGKTEFAYALSQEAGVTLKAVTTEERESGGFPGRRCSVNRKESIAMASMVTEKNDWLLVDEADSLLSTAGGFLIFVNFAGAGGNDKGVINTLIETFPVPGIWIVNNTDSIPLSTLRRFSYVYEFPEPDRNTRKRMLTERLEEEGNLLPQSFIDELTSSYRLTPSAIDRIIRVISCGDGEPGVPEDLVRKGSSFVKTMSRGPAGADFQKELSWRGRDTYDESLCNPSIPVKTVASLIKLRQEKDCPLKLLFSGPPGGGKTSFALHLGSLTDREVVVKKPSNILSKYVGEAEKQVARMFQEAEEKGAILVLDEVDAFFMNREQLSRSWEMSQASEWLQRLQEYSGILIACTNRADAMDPALRRRFHRAIHFAPMTNSMIDLALDHFFPGINFSGAALKRLYRLDLMISDFASAAAYLQDIPATSSKENPMERVIVDEILAESELRNPSKGRIGF